MSGDPCAVGETSRMGFGSMDYRKEQGWSCGKMSHARHNYHVWSMDYCSKPNGKQQQKYLSTNVRWSWVIVYGIGFTRSAMGQPFQKSTKKVTSLGTCCLSKWSGCEHRASKNGANLKANQMARPIPTMPDQPWLGRSAGEFAAVKLTIQIHCDKMIETLYANLYGSVWKWSIHKRLRFSCERGAQPSTFGLPYFQTNPSHHVCKYLN